MSGLVYVENKGSYRCSDIKVGQQLIITRHTLASLNVSSFPPEIWEMIIDEIGRLPLHPLDVLTRSRNLRACSLVCRSWVYRSRQNLFRFISIQDRESLTRFKTTLDSHSQHAKDVQRLELHSVPVDWALSDSTLR